MTPVSTKDSAYIAMPNTAKLVAIKRTKNFVIVAVSVIKEPHRSTTKVPPQRSSTILSEDAGFIGRMGLLNLKVYKLTIGLRRSKYLSHGQTLARINQT